MQLFPFTLSRMQGQPPQAAPGRLRLADFIRLHSEDILLAWDEFAATVQHEGKALDPAALRDHAAEILKTIAADLAQPQSAAQQDAKSKGQARVAPHARPRKRMRTSGWWPASRWTP